MSSDDSENQGLSEPHTPPEISALLSPAAEPEQQSLLLDDQDADCLFKGPVKHVADIVDAARRGRGRPAGSQNKANQRFRDVVLRMGFKHPGLNLASLANANPIVLAAELHCTALEAMQLIVKAAAELMPYFESKAPTEVHVDKTLRGVMLIGNMPTEAEASTAVMDLTRFDAPE